MSPRYDKPEPSRKLTPEEFELKIKGPEDIQMEHPLGGLRWVSPRHIRQALDGGWKHVGEHQANPQPSSPTQKDAPVPPKPKGKE